jgi:uncharacterized protein involved in exopolysaccharide biosynthesis/Mrp family chromosome partitioning ATPase
MMKSQPEPKLTHVAIEAICRQKRLFFVVLAAVLLLTVLIIVFIPKRYEATAQLLIENLRPHSSLSTQPVDKVVMSDDVTETQINSEVELLQSQNVLRKALDMAPLGTEANIAQMTREEQDLKKLQSRLAIDPVRLSSIINVKLTEASPTDAVNKLNAIFNAYFEERAALTRSAGTAEFFEAQTDEFGNKLKQTQEDLSKFEMAHELVDMNDQKKIVVTRIANLDDHIANARVILANQQGRTKDLSRKLQQTSPRAETTRRSLTNQYSQEHLNTELVDLQNHRAELLHRYPPTDRAIVELDQKVENIKNALQEANLHPAAENATDANPLWVQISSLMVTASAEISGTSAEQQELIAQKREAQARLRELLQSTGTFDDLNRRYQEVQKNYEIYASKRDEARISEALDSQKMFNVSLVQRPVSTSTPVRPKPIPYLLAGFVFGLCLASIIALYADRSSELIYSPEELDAVTQMLGLASIPDEDNVNPDLPETTSAGSVLEYRKLLSGIRALVPKPSQADGAQGRCVAFSSALSDEGVSTVVRNVAAEAAKQMTTRVARLDMGLLATMAKGGEAATVLLRADPRTGVWEVVPEPQHASLTYVDMSGKPVAMPQDQTIDLGNLHGERFWVGLDKLLHRARNEFELTLMDCPSLRSSTLAAELDGDVDGFVIVVGAGMVRKRQLEQLGSMMKQAGTPVIGYVLNRRTYPVPGWLYDIFW